MSATESKAQEVYPSQENFELLIAARKIHLTHYVIDSIGSILGVGLLPSMNIVAEYNSWRVRKITELIQLPTV